MLTKQSWNAWRFRTVYPINLLTDLQDFVNFAEEEQENIVDLNEGGYKFGLWENNLPKSTRY